MTQNNIQFSFHFDFSRKNLFWGALILLSALSIFFIFPEILMKTPEDEDAFFAVEFLLLYLLLIGSACLLCVIQFTIPQRSRRIIRWIILLLMPAFCTETIEWINSSDLFYSMNIVKWFGNYLCYLLLFLLIYAIFRRILPTVIIGSVISVAFGIATYYTIEFRGSPVLPWDFQSIFTAASVAGGYSYNATYQMAFTVFMLFFLFVVTAKTMPSSKDDNKRYRISERIITASFALVLAVALLPMDLLGNMGISVWPWNQKASTSMTGVSAGFFGNLQFLMVEKPDNYSKASVEALYQEISDTNNHTDNTAEIQNQFPTIIAVMNESFADLEAVSDGNITLTEDNMPFFHSLMESDEVISGTAYTSVFGGNTCDSEFEFLTGNSMSFLPTGSKPFQQYINTEQTSLMSSLKHYGYKSIAIHPGNMSAWNRDVTYPFLGFDEYIYNKTFSTNRIFLRGLTNDASCYNEVIYHYEQHTANSDDPLFIWNVTIQNHGGYEHDEYEGYIQIKDHEGEYPMAEEYLNLVKDSDDDFQILYNYFSQVDDPVIIVFFGDHWPKLEEEFTELVLGIDDLDSASIMDTMWQYEVPYFIWANFEMEPVDQDFSTTSLNYLSSLLLKSAGLEMTPYQTYLFELHETLSVVTSIGLIDKYDNYYLRSEDSPYQDLLNDYAILQYNQLFDKTDKVDGLFPLSG